MTALLETTNDNYIPNLLNQLSSKLAVAEIAQLNNQAIRELAIPLTQET